MEAKIHVKDSDRQELYTNDLITISVKVTFDNLEEKEVPGYIHSKNFPFLKKLAVNMIIVDSETRERIFIVDKLSPKTNSVEKEITQRI